jgi:hypothetical protein
MVRSKQVDPRIAAFRDLETRTANAWKSKFQQQLALAVSYLPTIKPQTKEDRAAIEDLIKSLKKKYLRGPPTRKGDIPPATCAEQSTTSGEGRGCGGAGRASPAVVVHQKS